MTDGTLPFSDTDYSKLDRKVFPTIRRRDKYGDVGDVNDITHGPVGNRETIGRAEIVAKETVTLEELSDQFLMRDTESMSASESVISINSFYSKPIGSDEGLTLYWNRWVDE